MQQIALGRTGRTRLAAEGMKPIGAESYRILKELEVVDLEETRLKPQEVFPVFVGSGRSGMTVLRTIFDAHPELATAHEPQFMGSVVRQAKRFAGAPFPVAEFIGTIYRNPNHRWLEIERHLVTASLEESPPSSLADAGRSVFALYADQPDEKLYGDSTPGYVIQIPDLAALFPEIRFVHVIRNGRNVALSYLERPFGPATVAEGALYWQSRVARGRSAGKRLGPERYTEVRCEDLVAQPPAGSGAEPGSDRT